MDAQTPASLARRSSLVCAWVLSHLRPRVIILDIPDTPWSSQQFADQKRHAIASLVSYASMTHQQSVDYRQRRSRQNPLRNEMEPHKLAKGGNSTLGLPRRHSAVAVRMLLAHIRKQYHSCPYRLVHKPCDIYWLFRSCLVYFTIQNLPSVFPNDPTSLRFSALFAFPNSFNSHPLLSLPQRSLLTLYQQDHIHGRGQLACGVKNASTNPGSVLLAFWLA